MTRIVLALLHLVLDLLHLAHRLITLAQKLAQHLLLLLLVNLQHRLVPLDGSLVLVEQELSDLEPGALNACLVLLELGVVHGDLDVVRLHPSSGL